MNAQTASEAAARKTKRWFFVVAGGVMVMIVVAGFWNSYFRPLVAGTSGKSGVIHFHALVYLGWIAMFLTQAALAATGRIESHRRAGKVGIAYGVLVIVVGVGATLYQYAGLIRARGLEASLWFPIWPLIDMLLFTPFFLLAVLLRRKPEIHKRLMIVAMTSLLIAPAGRLGLSVMLTQLVWLSPILLGLAYDLFRHRRVHWVYVMGVGILYASSYRPGLMRTDLWPEFARWLGALLV
jgi:hypothetical protein